MTRGDWWWGCLQCGHMEACHDGDGINESVICCVAGCDCTRPLDLYDALDRTPPAGVTDDGEVYYSYDVD